MDGAARGSADAGGGGPLQTCSLAITCILYSAGRSQQIQQHHCYGPCNLLEPTGAQNLYEVPWRGIMEQIDRQDGMVDCEQLEHGKII